MRKIILAMLLATVCTKGICSYADSSVNVFLDALYWHATETVDWVLINNRSSTNQEITYKTSHFNFEPGFRLGLVYNQDCDTYEDNWGSKFYYTYYYSDTTSSATGNLVSTFLGGKLIQDNKFFYSSGQMDFKINYNMFDWDIGKRYFVSDAIILRPIIGLRSGWIHQSVNTSFQGSTSVVEHVKNNFRGIGPKIGLESEWNLINVDCYKLNIIANLTSVYMWGEWNITDHVHDSAETTLYINTGKRNLGALTIHGLFGIGLKYKNLGFILGYEISDWFNQYQVFDDGTGAHNNDLVLQGATFRLNYEI